MKDAAICFSHDAPIQPDAQVHMYVLGSELTVIGYAARRMGPQGDPGDLEEHSWAIVAVMAMLELGHQSF